MAYEILNHGRVTWTNITRPTLTDIQRLGQAYPQFHPLDLEDCLSRIERPKIDAYDNYLFIVLHFPLWDPVRQISRPSEVDFFIGTGLLVTVHDGDLKPMGQTYEQCRDHPDTLVKIFDGGAARLLYLIIDRLVDYLFPILYKLDGNIRRIEEDLFTEDSRRIIQDISYVRRDAIALRRIIRPQLPIIYNLENVDRPFIREDLDVYFGDIHDHLQKARDIIEDNVELIAGLADTSDALASYRINEIIRILTVISVIMLPLSLITGILGMNVRVPIEEHPMAFWGVLGIMLIVSLSMLFYFRYRHWL